MGGARGALLASLPTVAYVAGEAVGGLATGAAAGAAAALLVLVERLRLGAATTPAVVGFLGVLGLVLLALVTGRPEAFFAPAVATLALEAAGAASASLGRRPVTGHAARLLGAAPARWRDDRRLVQLFCAQDALWAGVFATRAGVTAAFVMTGSVAGAGLFRLTGTPLYIALVALCVRWARPHLRGPG